MNSPIKVCITGAAGHLAYSLLPFVANGDVFGNDQPVVLSLLDTTPMTEVLQGVFMELSDSAYPLLREVILSADAQVAFRDADAAFLVGSVPLKEGMKRKDFLPGNVRIFRTHGQALDSVAKKSVKVLVVANPANTNALICSQFAPSIPKENFSCLTRLDQNRAQAQIAHHLGVSQSAVKNVIVWGNHSPTVFPDVRHATVVIGGEEKPVPEAVSDDDYIKNDFIPTVQKRGYAVIEARKLSSALSAAKASADHMKDWWQGTAKGQWVSMGVFSNGQYGIPEGLMYSFPVTITNKEWTIVKNLDTDDFARGMLDRTAKELQEERETVETFFYD